jgi:hypothetical protein
VNLTIGDHILRGEKLYGPDARKAAQQETGWATAFVWLVAAVAMRFPREKRHEGLSFHIYTRLRLFPDSITEPILKRAAAEGLGARTCYDLAVQMSGEDPTARLAGKNKSVRIPSLLHSKLKEHGNVNRIVREVLEEWLVGTPLTRQDSGQRTDAWRRAVAEAS